MGWRSYIRRLIRKLLDDDCPGLAAEMSYHFMLSFAPIFVLLITLLGFIGSNPDILLEIFGFLNRILPPGSVSLVEDLLTKIITGKSGGLAVMSLVIILWAGSNGTFAAIKALNRAYGFADQGKELSFWHQRFIALLVVMLLGLILFLAANAVVLGNLLLAYLKNIAYISGIQVFVASVVRWFFTIVLLTVVSAYIYATVPGPIHVTFPVRKVWPGAAAFVLIWLGFSVFFSHYVINIDRYNQIYDSLAGVIILMVWFYISSMAFLVGAEISALRCIELEKK